uniref:Uncharacterized protein n=1 Tax=Anopheles christyi TaxID=43041 RepID=A0A182JYI4_9DIPT
MKVFVLVSVVLINLVPVHSDQTDFNHINSDGSFAFGLKNSDTPGGHYHTASGNPKTIVRGRYGSRQPDTGRVEETVYTAGPRGFRARGPKIHRKQSLSQVQRGPIGTPEDPLADPYDDPSYDFQFKTRNYQRREGSDSNGRVNGLYTYIDDVGEKHSVRYSAGSGTGYEVANPVPDAPNTIAYESPLYKTHKQVRGKVAFESGPSGSGQYKLLSVGPDQRRAETTGPDGVTRGSYSYLDDKGVQRTVQYIAGAGIGYKVVQSTVGAGTHRLQQPNFGISHVEQSEFGDNNNPAYQTAPSGPASERPGTSAGGYDHVARPSAGGYDGGSSRPTAPGGSYDPPTGPSGAGSNYPDGPKPGIPGYPESSRPTGQGYDEEDFDSKRPTTSSPSLRPPTTDRPTGPSDSSETSREKYPLPNDPTDHDLGGYGEDSIIGLLPPKYDYDAQPGAGSSAPDHDDHDTPSLSGPFDVAISSGPSGPAPYPSFGESAPGTNAYNSNDFSGFPEVTYDQKKLEEDRKKDWRDFAKDSTIIKNVGDWYVGLAPGASVRAHIQNIDLLPYGGRAPSPGDALRRDTQAQAKSDRSGGRKPYDRRLTAKGCAWNLPASYYQGAGGSSGGYFGGRRESVLNNQGPAGANAGSWNGGGVDGGAAGSFPSQGQFGGGVAGGVDRTSGFGGNQWGGGDSRALGRGVAPGGVSTADDNLGAGGTGFQQGGLGGGVGGGSSGAPLGAGSGFGYNSPGNAGGLGSSNQAHQGQFTPHNTNGLASASNGFGGPFGAAGTGFGPGGQYNGNQHPKSYAGGPPAQPWGYGPAAGLGGHGVSRWPWPGVGYVYRVPVAHINPDGSYSFSYYTPHSSREETGHSNGNVEGSYGFQNDGAKHNFSFTAAPDVDLRSSIGDARAGTPNPDEYGPQSVHSRARLPLVPGTPFEGAVDEQTRTADGFPVSVERSQDRDRWPTRSGIDGVGSDVLMQNSEAGNDESSLAVVGLPKASTEASDASQPTTRDQVVRGSTEPKVNYNGGANELDGRLAGFDGTATTARPLGGSVEQVMARPVNDVPSYSNDIDRNGMQYNGGVGTIPVDRSYRFGYQTPDATRQEAADRAGNVRGSFSYNNEAGRNDLQYVAGAGMGFRPTGGSLSVPNGLPGAGSTAGGTTGPRTSEGDLSGPNGQRFGGGGGGGGGGGRAFVDDGRSLSSGNQGAQVDGGLGGAFGGSDTGFGGDGRLTGTGNQGVQLGGAAAPGAGFGSDGRPSTFGSQGPQLGGAFGTGSGAGFGTDGRTPGSGTQFGLGPGTGFGTDARALGSGGVGSGSGNGFGVDGRALGLQPGGGLGTGTGAGFGGDGRPLIFGSQGTQTNRGTGTGGGGFGADGRPLAFGNQGTQGGGAFDTGTGTGFGTGDFGNQGTQSGGGTPSGAAFGADGRRFGLGNQGTPFGAGGTGSTFGSSDGRSFGFGNQGRQGFSTADRGNQGTTHNPVTRSPSAGAFNGSARSGLSPVDAVQRGLPATSASSNVDAEESSTVNGDDLEQTTTFGGYGDISSTGLFTNANRRLIQ